MGPNKLHPTLVSAFNRPRQTLTDVKTVGSGPPFSSFDVYIQQGQDVPLEVRENVLFNSVGAMKRNPILLQARGGRRSHDMTVFDSSPMGDWSLQELVDASYVQEQLRFHSRVSQSRSKREVQDEALGQAVILCTNDESISRPGRQDSKQMEPMELGADIKADDVSGVPENPSRVPQEIMGVQPCLQGIDAKGGINVYHRTSKRVSPSVKDGCGEDGERGDSISECDSSDWDSSRSVDRPQILGVSHQFSSPQRESGSPKDLHFFIEGPMMPCAFLTSPMSQIRSPAQKSERERSSKSMKLFHVLQEHEESASLEPECVRFVVDSCEQLTVQDSDGAAEGQKEMKKGNGRTDQDPRVWEDGGTKDSCAPPECLYQMADCQGSNSPCQHTEVRVTQTRKTAENYSKIEVGEGTGENKVGLCPL